MDLSFGHRLNSVMDRQDRVIGQTLHFVSGQFAGQDIRVELQELQKAEIGRKYARVDRRPLDPPPVVLLRLFRVYDADTERQREEEILDHSHIGLTAIQNIGILCMVDLFPVPEPALCNPLLFSSSTKVPSVECSQDLRHHLERFTFFPLYPFSSHVPPGVPDIPCPLPPRQNLLCRAPSLPREDVVYRLGNHFITESSKLTAALVGEKYVEPVLVRYEGRKVLVFVFGDLAVQREGHFILRYRVFDVFSHISPGMCCPVQAELYGGPFQVYSSRDFPGLSASTELTKTLSKYCIRLVKRDVARLSQKRRKQDGDDEERAA
ncbi:putative velvet factor [Lyophyllum shimeji]|uniref:Velvet factor n=1 Tax=Lyophyllum shimeji TaxID=47721 RepID=A0A9P3PJU8_LYOSH|nr:putative velvet factor [Lyophyllum shimeji]